MRAASNPLAPHRQRFTARDLKRAIKAALAAGLAIGSVRIEPDGAIVLLTGDVPSSAGPNDWD
jgi:hypothetical protein